MIDLHTHSNCSDGSMTPSELIFHAKKEGLSVIALTDHDTTEGIDEAMDAAARVGITLMPGVEFSFDVTFPDTYGNADLAGKEGEAITTSLQPRMQA